MRSDWNHNVKEVIKRKTSTIIISLLGAWIVSFPYEGQLLYALAKNYGIDSGILLDISLVMQVVGLILGGIFVKSIKTAKNILIYIIPVCILCTVTFFFPSYIVWAITLTACSTAAGICITAAGHLLKNDTVPWSRFQMAVEIIIYISILKMIINNISLHVSIQAGITFTLIILAAAWYLNLITLHLKERKTAPRIFDKKAGIKALFMLFLFIMTIAIDFGIMIQIINPKYSALEWLSSWYWLFPYVGAAVVMMRMKKADDRSNVLYTAVGMIGFGFLLFVILDHSIGSFLIVNTIMMGAWAVFDVFWWSILAEMFDMTKNPSAILSVGFSALMIGVLLGKVIADYNPVISELRLYVVPMAVICITLFIMPVLHRYLSLMIKKNAVEQIVLPENADSLTDREKQITGLLLKGRTYKLIAAELHLSENTVKTHIKNIYSKLGVKNKSELINFMTE